MLEGVTIYRQHTWGGSCFFQMTFHSSFLKELTLYKIRPGLSNALDLFVFVPFYLRLDFVSARTLSSSYDLRRSIYTIH